MEGHHQPEPEGGRSGNWRNWLTAIAGIVLLIFVLQNSREEEIDFLFASVTAPLVFALIFAGLLGALIGWAAPRVRRGGRD